MEACSGLGRTSTPQGVYAQRRLDSAHKRYLHAIRQLAAVRNLLRPADETAARTGGRGRTNSREQKTPPTIFEGGQLPTYPCSRSDNEGVTRNS
jgi:hypothetical protein